MNLFTAAFSKIFKSGNQQVLDKIKPCMRFNNKVFPAPLGPIITEIELLSN